MTQIERPRARRVSRFLAPLALVLLAAGCSTGPGSKAEFVDVLTRDGALTENEATCISDAVFDEYELDEDALGKISAAPDYEYLSSEEGVPGFADFFDRTVASCSTVGPTTG
ncbi:MAG: hypothetical protein ACRBK7_13380 [Acidimicrobiales bacterium]